MKVPEIETWLGNIITRFFMVQNNKVESKQDGMNKFNSEPFRVGSFTLMTADILHPQMGRALGLDVIYPVYRVQNTQLDKTMITSELQKVVQKNYNMKPVGNKNFNKHRSSYQYLNN
jgi:hypothetical protein